MTETEKSLVEKVLAGRLEAFEPLVTPYRERLLALAYRLTWNWEDAREVAQEALLRAFKHLGRYDTSRSFRNWLFQIAANAARDRARTKKRERDVIESADLDAVEMRSPEAGCAAGEFRNAVMKCLAILSPREREVFIMRDLEDLDIKETARALGCSTISVRVNLSSARRKMREALGGSGAAPEAKS